MPDDRTRKIQDDNPDIDLRSRGVTTMTEVQAVDNHIGDGMTTQWSKLRRCLTAPHARLGWILMVIGAMAWQMFGRHADWSSLLFYRQQLLQTHGTIHDVAGTGFAVSDGDTQGAPIRSVRFEFTDLGGVKWTGRSWTESPAPIRGEQVLVEYVAARPEINRIVNSRSGPLPLWAGAVLLFPFFGILCVLQALVRKPDQMVDRHAGS